MIEFDKEQPGKTNFERLNEMSEDKLNAFFDVYGACETCAYGGINCGNKSCRTGMLNWLNQPYEGAKNDEY